MLLFRSNPEEFQMLRREFAKIGNTPPCNMFGDALLTSGWRDYEVLPLRNLIQLVAGNWLVFVKMQAVFGFTRRKKQRDR